METQVNIQYFFLWLQHRKSIPRSLTENSDIISFKRRLKLKSFHFPVIDESFSNANMYVYRTRNYAAERWLNVLQFDELLFVSLDFASFLVAPAWRTVVFIL